MKALVLVIALMVLPLASAIITDDIYAYWTFDTDADQNTSVGNNTLLDFNAHPSFSPSMIINGGKVFDGVNQGLNFTYVGANFPDLTISAWLRPDDVNKYFMYSVNTGANTVISLQSQGGVDVGGMSVYDGTGWLIFPNSAITDSQFRFFVWTFNGSNNNASLYINGVFNSSVTTYDGDILLHNIGIGDYVGCGGVCGVGYDGRADEMGLWNRTLNPLEVSTLFNNGDGLAYPFTNQINLTIYDEFTNEKLDIATVTVIKSTESQNKNTTDGNMSFSITPDTYELIYNSPTSFQRHYYFTLINLSSSGVDNINLYLLNTSTTNAQLVTYTVTDENGVPLNNATVKVLRFYPELNTYIIVEMSISDTNGAGGLHLEKINPKYMFIVERNGVVIISTQGAQIFQDDILLRADLSEDVIESLVSVIGMQKSLTFTNVTNDFTLTWNDNTGVTSEVCLTVSKVSLRSTKEVNSSCVNSASGSITLGIGENRTGQYVARANLETTTQFSPALLTELSVWLENNLQLFGGMAIFLSALLILGVSLTLIFMTQSAVGGIMGVIIGVILSVMLGLLSIGITIIIGIIIVGLLVMFLTRARGAT